MVPNEPSSSIGAINNLDAPATSEEVRALITVMWELVNRFDRVLVKFEPQPNDPRNKPSPFKSCY
jgi:hypothetical protein